MIPNNDEHKEAFEKDIIKANKEEMHKYYEKLSPEMQDIMVKAESLHDLMIKNHVPHLFYIDDCSSSNSFNLTKFYYPLKNGLVLTSKEGLSHVYSFFTAILLNVCLWSEKLQHSQMFVIQPKDEDNIEAFGTSRFEEEYLKYLSQMGGEGEDNGDV